MCGIAGIFNADGRSVESETVARMSRAIAHRGPDGEGVWANGPIGLGHRRLAIIDLSSSGSQPMANNDGTLQVVFNGEIYNYKELRKELEGLGHQFRSTSDTEVLLHAYEQWGADCLIRFNGMFAFAIWDVPRRELFLARDRYGIKPLYYAVRGETFLFGSEVKALLAHNSCPAQLDQEALLEYFTFQNFFTDRTLFNGVKMLPAGTWLRLKSGASLTAKPQRWWDYNFQEPQKAGTEAEYLEELERLFQQSVRRQLVSDVEIGAYLSGGMDSGSITAIAAKQFPYLKTFTCGFDLSSASGLELAFDERSKAEHMSYLFKTEHYEMVLKAGDMERVLPSLAWHIEEPRVGQSYPNFYVARLASKFVKVCLSGAGGDEMFGGYPWRYYRAVVNDDFEHYVDKYYSFWQRLIPNTAIQRVFKPIWNNVKHVWTRDIFRDVFTHHAGELSRPEDYVNHSLYFEAKTFLHGLLVVEDKLSMAHGLETRVPFLDNDLVDFAMKVPVNMKLGNLKDVVRLNENEPGPKTKSYYEKTHDGKLLLRKAMERHIPQTVTGREKQGFSAPDASWFKGDSVEYVRRELMGSNSRIYEFMDADAVRGLVNEHIEGKQNRRLLLWSLLNFENFLKRFFPG